MSREERTVKIKDGSNELTFKIRQMSATQTESWILRALLLLGPALGKAAGEGATVSEAIAGLQSNWLALLAGVDYSKAQPLLDELLLCCARVVSPGVTQACEPSTIDAYVSDVRTLLKLRQEAIKLSLGFLGLGQGGPSTSQTSLAS